MITLRTLLGGFGWLAPLGVLVAACDEPTAGPATGPAPAADAAPVAPGPQGTIRFLGPPARIGNGLARTYLLVGEATATGPSSWALL